MLSWRCAQRLDIWLFNINGDRRLSEAETRPYSTLCAVSRFYRQPASSASARVSGGVSRSAVSRHNVVVRDSTLASSKRVRSRAGERGKFMSEPSNGASGSSIFSIDANPDDRDPDRWDSGRRSSTTSAFNGSGSENAGTAIQRSSSARRAGEPRPQGRLRRVKLACVCRDCLARARSSLPWESACRTIP